MARWKLTEAHYLHGYPPDLAEDGVEWEYKETDRMNGRERRKRFKVPFFMENGTIVCYEGRGQPTDTVFEGSPTPAMDPLDEEARAISDAERHKWIHPIESLQGQGFNDALLQSLTKQLAAIAANAPAPNLALGTVSKEEFDALQAQLAELTARNAELEASQEPKAIPRKRL